VKVPNVSSHAEITGNTQFLNTDTSVEVHQLWSRSVCVNKC